ncbi:hypothetical protein [Moorena sp. SIO3I8]|uniref:hypothetical protein n=1 Tax=Moorena sp. SIO3I8 TaxID=2607833 RepID=UPI0013C0202B|nr:hypothetical protein [Moorena sp. SIO3I8]NEO07398.1 hypothetical protein [Moorena sp. SIO3I8]
MNLLLECAENYELTRDDYYLGCCAIQIGLYYPDQLDLAIAKMDALQRIEIIDSLANEHDIFLDGDMTLLILDKEELSTLVERSRQAYPNYEMYLLFDYEKVDGEWLISSALYWKPLIGAPIFLDDSDFPTQAYWDDASNFIDDFEMTLRCYPNEESFSSGQHFEHEEEIYFSPFELKQFSAYQLLAAA